MEELSRVLYYVKTDTTPITPSDYEFSLRDSESVNDVPLVMAVVSGVTQTIITILPQDASLLM